MILRGSDSYFKLPFKKRKTSYSTILQLFTTNSSILYLVCVCNVCVESASRVLAHRPPYRACHHGLCVVTLSGRAFAFHVFLLARSLGRTLDWVLLAAGGRPLCRIARVRILLLSCWEVFASDISLRMISRLSLCYRPVV